MGKGGTIGIVIILIVLAVVVGIFIFNLSGDQQEESSAFPAQDNLDVPETVVVPPNSGEESDDEEIVEETPVETPVEVEKIVEITPSGFSPKTLEINLGDKVTWINKGSTNSWPASAFHPTHTIYPGSSISKCGTVERGNIFDACSSFGEGGSYSFTFNEVGNWNYHDHLISSKTGTIIVN